MSDPIVAFTDGASSGNPGPGGWGAILRFPDDTVRELGGGERTTTNNRMELAAVIAALEATADHPAAVLVLTDSTYVRKGITQWISGWIRKGWTTTSGTPVANRDQWEELHALTQARSGDRAVDWRYVAGHAGIPGNERADEIAVAYTQGRIPDLYEGPAEGYPVDLTPPGDGPGEGGARRAVRRVPGGTASGGSGGPIRSGSRRGGKAYSYLSLLDGVLCRHRSWPECERRVKGRPARFKKALSPEDERNIVREWGLDPARLDDA